MGGPKAQAAAWGAASPGSGLGPDTELCDSAAPRCTPLAGGGAQQQRPPPRVPGHFLPARRARGGAKHLLILLLEVL